MKSFYSTRLRSFPLLPFEEGYIEGTNLVPDLDASRRQIDPEC